MRKKRLGVGGGGILVNSNYYIPSTKLLFGACGYEAIIYGVLYDETYGHV
jgi:hypothetical protein